VTFSDPPPQFSKDEVDTVLYSAQAQSAQLEALDREVGRSKEFITKVRAIRVAFLFSSQESVWYIGPPVAAEPAHLPVPAAGEAQIELRYFVTCDRTGAGERGVAGVERVPRTRTASGWVYAAHLFIFPFVVFHRKPFRCSISSRKTTETDAALTTQAIKTQDSSWAPNPDEEMYAMSSAWQDESMFG
jgi:hypothetical protein